MDVSASAALAVQHGRPSVSGEVQRRPRGLLEGVQNRADLFVGSVWSSGAHAITPEVYLCSKERVSATWWRISPEAPRRFRAASRSRHGRRGGSPPRLAGVNLHPKRHVQCS